MTHTHRRSRARLAVLVASAIAVLTLDARSPSVIDRARLIVGRTLEPGRRGWQDLVGDDALRTERDRLRARLRDLEGQRAVLEAAEAEAAAVLRSADLSWAGDVPRLGARVLGPASSNLSPAFEIDRGSEDGLEPGMTVVAGGGLVGRVDRVLRSTAWIQPITDPRIRIGVRVLPNGPFGTVRGGGDGNPLVVDAAARPDEVDPDQLVVTSGGAGSRFPAGIPVGRVHGDRATTNGVTVDLLVGSDVDLSGLGFVEILLWRAATP
jgi:rod shape-determining protein MreC